MSQVESGGAFSGFKNFGKSSKGGALGTAFAPLHTVTVEGGGFKEQLWRTIRSLGLAFVLISGVGSLIEVKAIGKGALVQLYSVRII